MLGIAALTPTYIASVDAGGTNAITSQPGFGSSSRLTEATRSAPFSSTPNISTVLEPYCSMKCGQSKVALSLVDLMRQPWPSISAKRPCVISSLNKGVALAMGGRSQQPADSREVQMTLAVR